MNSGLTSERVYTALKRRLLGGEFRPGERLDPAQLSETLSSSVTPVRDVLNILRGEGLVETRTGEGFFRPHVTAPDLEDLYVWSDQVLQLTIRHWRDGDPSTTGSDASRRDLAERTTDLFFAIGLRSPNAEHRRTIAGVNDRLHGLRSAEALVLGDVMAELEALELAFETDARMLVRLLVTYHRHRQRAASEIVRALYRGA